MCCYLFVDIHEGCPSLGEERVVCAEKKPPHITPATTSLVVKNMAKCRFICLKSLKAKLQLCR